MRAFIFTPGVIYFGASDKIAQRMIDSINDENAKYFLRSLAWIGTPVVQKAFHSWRDSRPSSGDYALEAGWESTANGGRRDLFHRECHPLLKSRNEDTDSRAVSVLVEHEEMCRWCGLAMTTLVDLDLTNPLTGFLGLKGSRLRIANCEYCAPFTRTFLTNVDLTGKSTWHESNEKPDYLREPSGARFPAKRLRLGRTERHWLESVSWLLPGASFSQVGGHPTWIGGAAYPPCPQCEQLMPFVGQFSVDDIEKFG